MLTHDTRVEPPHQEPHPDLVRQGYLLTGDPERARQLAARAAAAGQLHGRRHGPAEALEHARAELVRSFVADPGRPRTQPAGTAAPHPDVAVWQALCRLSPRRRVAIVLRYDEGLTEEQTAERLGTSARTVRADVDAALLTLRTALPGVEAPWTRIADALSAAGRGWSDYTHPAPGRVAEVLASPAPTPAPRVVEARQRALQPAVVVAAVVTLLLIGAAVLVPRLGRDDPAPAPAAAAAGPQVLPRGAARQIAPSVDVPRGLLNWPARGSLSATDGLLAAATTAWKAKVPAAEAPASGVGVLWAGTLDGRTIAVLQGLDRGNHPRLAQLSGTGATTLALQHAEPLHAGTQVLSLLPPSGPSGPVRVLVSPEGQLADGLLASNPMNGMPLQRMPVDDSGISGVLPSPPGTPTCSRVVLLGFDPTDGSVTGPRVLFSGIMSADMLGGMPGRANVEVGTSSLAAPFNATPETAWFADGEKLAKQVPGRGLLTVAAFGPRLAPQRLSDTDRRMVSSRAYELRRGGGRWIGSVVDLDGKTVCHSVLPAGAGSGLTAWALRCPLPGEMMPGIVHVVAAPDAQRVDVALKPTRAPAGQEPFTGTATRPDDAPAPASFAALLVAHMGFPCGQGTLTVHHDQAAATVALPVYLP
ncbi:MAG TPA: sigma factor-like helix-turn-helix DNA-binding protein [Mycobacteriales bacterium]|nr:sigma factor-like helix-turn-helix DNA-binding protein [Mycobacteriales bacterium]